eukprot:UN24835
MAPPFCSSRRFLPRIVHEIPRISRSFWSSLFFLFISFFPFCSIVRHVFNNVICIVFFIRNGSRRWILQESDLICIDSFSSSGVAERSLALSSYSSAPSSSGVFERSRGFNNWASMLSE